MTFCSRYLEDGHVYYHTVTENAANKYYWLPGIYKATTESYRECIAANIPVELDGLYKSIVNAVREKNRHTRLTINGSMRLDRGVSRQRGSDDFLEAEERSYHAWEQKFKQLADRGRLAIPYNWPITIAFMQNARGLPGNLDLVPEAALPPLLRQQAAEINIVGEGGEDQQEGGNGEGQQQQGAEGGNSQQEQDSMDSGFSDSDDDSEDNPLPAGPSNRVQPVRQSQRQRQAPTAFAGYAVG